MAGIRELLQTQVRMLSITLPVMLLISFVVMS
jgi:hypothetical protein